MAQADKSNSQLVAHCSYSKGEIKLENYTKFYATKNSKSY